MGGDTVLKTYKTIDERDKIGFKALACAVVEKAIDDYIDALAKNDKYEIGNIELFFKSQWCYELCGLDGNYIITEVKKKYAKSKKDN